MVWVVRTLALGIAVYALIQFASGGGFWPWYLFIIGGGVIFGGSFARVQRPKK